MVVTDRDRAEARWYAETANLVLDLAPKFVNQYDIAKAKAYAMRLLDKSMKHTNLPPPDESKD